MKIFQIKAINLLSKDNKKKRKKEKEKAWGTKCYSM